MSAVFECSCGRRTTEPFVIRGLMYCTICADEIDPKIVSSRENHNIRRFGARKGHSPGYDRSEFDARGRW